MSGTTCGYERDDGSACGSTVGLCPDCGHCANHCEHRRDVMQAARAKGGNVTKRKKESEHLARKGSQWLPADEGVEIPDPPQTAADAKAYLAWIVDAMARGAIGSALGRDMSQVCDRFVRAAEKAELEARVKKLEQALEEADA